jgi:7-cyano-7-deazaguanine synthase
MSKDLAIVLSNGSLNSCVAAALAAQRFRTVMMNVIITENMGARLAYDAQVAHFKPYREHTVNLSNLAMMARDPRMPCTVAQQLVELVPVMAMAGRYAAHYEAAAVYCGLRVGPEMEQLAPASEFISIWNEMLQLPCAEEELELHAPLLELEAWQVVEVGTQIGAPMEKSWSCTEDGEHPCGNCRACRNREAAFVQAARGDATAKAKYASRSTGFQPVNNGFGKPENLIFRTLSHGLEARATLDQ